MESRWGYPPAWFDSFCWKGTILVGEMCHCHMVDLDPFLVKEEGGAKLCLRLTKHPPTKTLKTIKRTRIKGGEFVGLDSYSWSLLHFL